MSESFSVGEIAIAIERDTECEIVMPLHENLGWNPRRLSAGLKRAMYYGVKFPDSDLMWLAEPHELRKRRPPPPREQTSTWDDVVVWRPKTKEASRV